MCACEVLNLVLEMLTRCSKLTGGDALLLHFIPQPVNVLHAWGLFPPMDFTVQNKINFSGILDPCPPHAPMH